MTATPPQGADPRALLDSVGVLGDESRWRLFTFIRRARRAVTREEAAETVGMSRKLAAFHLDKMVAAGLLRAHYGRDREVAKVGRRPKVYEAVGSDISVSIPGRQYQLLADLLIEAVLNDAGEVNAADAANRAARERGSQLGAAHVGAAAAGAERLRTCTATLEEYGYEPAPADDGVRLRNCPFHPLAAKAPELVCGMNHSFLAGYLDGLAIPEVDAVLDPQPGECCVRLASST